MMCDYPCCKEEAVGRAIDAYGSNVYCEKHLQEVEGKKGIQVIRFRRQEEVVEGCRKIS